MNNPIYVFGHKNPDPDSICAAISYADFKKHMGEPFYVPARCGNSNARIDTILEQFKTPLPVFMGDVKPRVKDIMVQPKKAYNDFTCAEALEIMDTYDIRALPVVDRNEILQGLVSIFTLGEYFIPKTHSPSELRHVHTTSLSAIVRTLKAKVLHLVNPEEIEDLSVRVVAMSMQSFGTLVHNAHLPANKSVVVVGDREDIQEKSIEMRIRLLVLSAETLLCPKLLEKAKINNVSVISSMYDSATTTWLIKCATLLSGLINPQVITFCEDEKLTNVKKKIGEKPLAPIYMVVDETQKLLGAFTKSDIIKPIDTKIALVDHNELSQAVDGASEVTITEIIDHHRLGNMPTEQPILFFNEPIGSTCSIIADMYIKNNLTPSPNIAGILMSGIITDTLLLKSPTTTPKDGVILAWLEKIAGISSQQLSDIIFSTGSIILSAPAQEVVCSDCKIYEEYGFRYSVAQIEEVSFDNFWKHAGILEEALENYRQKEKLYVSLLLVTNVTKQDSILIVKGHERFLQLVSYAQLNDNHLFDCPGVVSRKKQLIPYVTQIIKQLSSNQ